MPLSSQLIIGCAKQKTPYPSSDFEFRATSQTEVKSLIRQLDQVVFIGFSSFQIHTDDFLSSETKKTVGLKK